MAEKRFAPSADVLFQDDDPFGVLEQAPVAAKVEGVPFAVVALAGPDILVERVELPASFESAQVVLDAKRQSLRRGQAKLHEAQDRMAQLGQSQAVEQVSFAAAAGPEADLRATLQAIKEKLVFEQDPEQERSQRELGDFVKQIRHMVSNPVRVETKVGKSLVGYTTIGWSGDWDTIWHSDATFRSMRMHRQALQVVVDRRAARVRLLVVVSAGAAKLIVQLATPGAQVMVLPAAWKFVRDVLQELR